MRRESDGEIYQEAHSSDNRFFTRRRTAGGYWSPWREFADLNGNSSTRFKVAAAVFNDEAVRLEQLNNAVNTAFNEVGVYSSYAVFDYTGSTELWQAPVGVNSVIVVMVAGGGGGGQGGGNDGGSEQGGGGGGAASGQWVVLKVDNLAAEAIIAVLVGAGGVGGFGATVINSDGFGYGGGDTAITVPTRLGTETYTVKGGFGGLRGGWGDDNGSAPPGVGAGGTLSTYIELPTVFLSESRRGQVAGQGGGVGSTPGNGGLIPFPNSGPTSLLYYYGKGGNGSTGGYNFTSSAANGETGADCRVVIFY